jgi:acetyl esterase/lipase
VINPALKIGVLTLLAVVACGPTKPVAPPPARPSAAPSPSPSPLFGDMEVRTGLLACPAAGTAEDIYYPRWSGSPAPAIVFIHGGSWVSGSRTDVTQTEPLLSLLRGRGYAVVSIDYRLAPASRWPAMYDDSRCAFANLRRDAAALGLDPARIAALGVSAGAQLALLLGFELPISERPRFVIEISGPVDLTSPDFGSANAGVGAQVFGATSASDPVLKSASPVTYAAAGDPPVLIVHGTADATVPFSQAQELQRVLQQHGDAVQLVSIPNGTHDLAGSLGAELQLSAFLDRYG